MLTRCKVACVGKIIFQAGETQLNFSPVYNGSEENREFFKYTPGGMIYFNVVNQTIADKFEIGKEYYMDFSLA